MRTELLILGAALWACFLPGCVRQRMRPDRPDNAPSEFDRPAECFIYVGMPQQDLLALMGRPQNIERQQAREIWYYDFGLVVLEDSQVAYRYPPRADAERSPLPHSQGRSDQH